MKNREVADTFQLIADLLEIKGESIYRVLAYRKASDSIRDLTDDVSMVWQEGRLEKIPGIGKAISEKIDEILGTGKLAFLDRLTAEIPSSVVELLHVGDVGPKKAARFWKELGITNLSELEAAARAGKIRTLRGMGERSELRILESIEALKRRETNRISIAQAWDVANYLLGDIKQIDGVFIAEAAGSVRRWRETIGDLDLIVAAEDQSQVLNSCVAFPWVARVVRHGDTKASIELKDGLRVQIWVHPPPRFGSALQYATGSQAHNVRLRELARQQALSLSEHGFKREDGSEITCAEEAQVYQTLGLPWIPPELREDHGEVQAALDRSLPNLITTSDLKGELHSHTDWSDGTHEIHTMAEAALERGFSYLAVTDHSRGLGIANGLSVPRLREQRKAVHEVQQLLGDAITLLHGTEVEILADGRLDYPDEILAELDLVIASIHTSLRQSRQKITQRLQRAIQNPHVDVIAHPTGRLIGSREPADLDMDEILRTAAKHGVVLAINANPERLDLNEIHARRAVELGCLLAINTDAHNPEQFALQSYGIGIARRAWVEAETVINTWSLGKLRKWLNERGCDNERETYHRSRCSL
jgi:DNA polymerase (family 10)